MKSLYKRIFYLNTSKKIVSFIEWVDGNHVYVRNGFYAGSVKTEEGEMHIVIPEYVTNTVVRHVSQIFVSLEAAYNYIKETYPDVDIVNKKTIHI